MKAKLIKIRKSHRLDKKYDAIVEVDGKEHVVPFGAKKLVDGKYIPYSDYTVHKDPERKKRYITRHRKREDWDRSGLLSPGFWSRWILWNLPSLTESVEDTRLRFGL